MHKSIFIAHNLFSNKFSWDFGIVNFVNNSVVLVLSKRLWLGHRGNVLSWFGFATNKSLLRRQFTAKIQPAIFNNILVKLSQTFEMTCYFSLVFGF